MATKAGTKNLKPRPPVVAIVGHVDHGKTTLLDYIRKTNVAGREEGNITQSIGAYEIEHKGKKITFIDTPGHEAFSTMRARGTVAADLAVLVVAADEGIKPQTTESIEILKKTSTPFVVAITKIDSSNADVEKVKNELVSTGISLEGAGGDISWQAVSGKTGEGVDDLLGLIVLAGEVAGLTFNPNAHANGFIIETKKDSRRGVLAHIILKDGILGRGNEIVTKSVSGKVKILENFLGEPVKELAPSAPAIVGSFEDLPKSGEEFWAGNVNVKVVDLIDGGGSSEALKSALEAITGISPTEAEEGEKEKVKVVLKADSAGSLEALRQILVNLVKVTDASVGEISDSDVQFAKSTGSVIVGFRVSAGKAAEKLASFQRVKILTSGVIYELVEVIESLERVEEQVSKGGTLEVLATFSGTQNKQTIGGKVTEGIVRISAPAQIIRGEENIGKGRIKNLQQNKEDVKEVAAGSEAGLVISTDTKIEEGDILKVA